MKKAITLMMLMFLLTIMAVTNPDVDDYNEWANNMIKNETKVDIETASLKDMITNFGVNLFAPTIIKNSTIEKDYIFFTMFSTEIEDITIKTIGVFDRFIPLDIKE